MSTHACQQNAQICTHTNSNKTIEKNTDFIEIGEIKIVDILHIFLKLSLNFLFPNLFQLLFCPLSLFPNVPI